MELDKRKIDAIELLIEGEKTRKNIAELVGVQRKTLYEWFKNKEFVSEWDRRIHEIEHLTQKGFNTKLEMAKDKLWEIICSESDIRTREKALEYWINRGLGTPTSKIEQTVNDNTSVDSNVLAHLYANDTEE